MRYVDAFCDMRCQDEYEDANSFGLFSLDAETMAMQVAAWHEHGVCPNCGAPRQADDEHERSMREAAALC